MQVFAYKMCNFLKKVFQCPPIVDDYFVARDKGVPAHEARRQVAAKHETQPIGVRYALDWFFHEAKKRKKYDFLQKFSHEVEH